jgi:hypothetical protein
VTPSKKSICKAPFDSYLWFKQVEDRAQDEALKEAIAPRFRAASISTLTTRLLRTVVWNSQKTECT